MKKAKFIYWLALGSAVALFGLASFITPGLDAAGWTAGMVRFVILCAAAGCSVLTWATAVAIVSNHRVVWPLALATAIVVCTAATFAVTRWRADTVVER